jgi:hypothetical protein
VPLAGALAGAGAVVVVPLAGALAGAVAPVVVPLAGAVTGAVAPPAASATGAVALVVVPLAGAELVVPMTPAAGEVAGVVAVPGPEGVVGVPASWADAAAGAASNTATTDATRCPLPTKPHRSEIRSESLFVQRIFDFPPPRPSMRDWPAIANRPPSA